MPLRASQCCLCRMEDLRREKVAAEERAALSATEKRETERNAAAQLSAAHQQTQDAMEVGTQAKPSTRPCHTMHACLN